LFIVYISLHLLFLFIIEEDVNIMGVIAAPNLTPILLFNIIQNKLIKSQTEQHNIFLRERRESHYELLLLSLLFISFLLYSLIFIGRGL
jgi:hypothetical protein